MGAREHLPLPHLHHHHHLHRLFPPDLPCYDDFSAISRSEKSVSAASDKNVEAPGRDFSSGSSMGESPGPRLKFMCSFGGAILPRPGDGKLRYAGGDTRIVSVHLHISYADLMRKMRQFYGEAVLLKYQLPGEDLDALVSVTSDEDLENMTEEYMKLEASQGPSRLRIFLFSPAENDAVHQNLSAAQTNTDQIYVDAINGVSVAGLDMAGVSSSKNLRALEALEAWNASQFFENASEAMLGAPIRQRTSASFVQSPNVLSRIMLGSPSPPPPPPISTVPSQPPQVGQCAIPDLSLNFYPEQLAKIAVRGYEPRLDEIHHELEGIGSASRSQLDGPYRPLESRSVSGSPTKTQQETMLAPLGKNLNELYPREQLHMADVRMPRVDSRGCLMTRVDSYGRMPAVNSHSMLMPQQVEQAVSSDRPMDNNIPDISYLPLDVQHLYAQQQMHLSQAACQHPLEVGGDGQLKMDPVDFMQVQQHAQYHYQQITSQHYPLTDKSACEVSAFEQCVQQQEALNGQLPCKSMALQTNHHQSGTKAIPVPVSHLGSAPPSPRMPHWENNMKQNRGHLPVLQSAFGGFVDQPYGKMRGQPHIELANSLLKPANMPLHAQEQLPYIEDQVTFQQAPMPFGNLESLPKVQKGDPFHKKNQALHSEFYDLDGVTRAMTPSYPGVTTYQDSSSSFSNCEMSRRDEFANNSCYIDKVHVIVQNTHNHSEEMSGGWTHAHKIDTREVMTSGFVSSQIAETLFVNAPSLRISEPSVGGVAVTDTYLTAQNTRSQFDPLGNTLVHSRSNFVPSAVAQHLPAPGRTLFSDSSQPGGDVLGTQVTMQAGTKILDTSAFPSSFKETLYAPPLSIATARNSDVQLDGFGYVQMDSPLSAFPPVSSVSKTESVFLAKMEEGRWTEDSESGFHNPGGHLSEAAYDSTGVLVQDDELNRPASSRTAADPDDTLVKSEVLISKSTSNKSLLDDDTFVPLYSQTETVISNGTSYVVGIGVSTMGLSIFPTDITLSPRASTSAAGGSSVTSPCLNPVVVEAFPVSSCLPHPLEDSSCGNLSSTKGVDLVESADMRAEVPVPDLRASITTFGVISVQASQGLEDREVSPRFGSAYVQESGMHEDEDEGIQGDLEYVAKNVVAAVFKPTLYSSPTLSIQNWENALANVKLDEQETEESLPVDKSLDEVKVNIDEKEVTFQDAKRGSQEAESDGLIKNKSMNLAVVAEAEAISRGLQTIKNLDLEELRELGSGTFGTVYHGKWRGTDVAIKRIKSSCFSGKPSERERLIADFWKEAYILGQLHHPNVVAFYGVVPDGPGDTLATVTEYMVNGSLKQVLQKKDRTIDRRKRLLIIMDAAFGMEYLHGKNIVHFDLKCENLLVNMKDPHRPICKVGDLGLSKVKHQTMVSGGVRGTLPWMAPELLNGSSNLVSEKVDVFSFGIVMWELLTGEEPYANMHYGAIIGGIVNNTLRPPVPSWCDPSWKSLMERCWSADPEERPAFSNIASELRAMATLASSKAA